jgi:predicted amidohydrolase
MIKCGIVQAGSVSEVQQNIEKLKKYVTEAKEKECAVICFPEAFLTGYVPQMVSELSVMKDSNYIQQVSDIARQYCMDVLVGFMEQDYKNEYYLTQGIFRGDGSSVYYRKTHLGQREQEVFATGEKLSVFELSCGLKVGIQLCVETHFPEITQTLSLRGAEIVFAPHAVPRRAGSRNSIWSKIIPARSYDNRVYMACCNLWDEEKFGGGCLVTDPAGEVVVSYYKEQEGLVCFEVDREKVRSYHEGNGSMKKRYYPELRRVELY